MDGTFDLMPFEHQTKVVDAVIATINAVIAGANERVCVVMINYTHVLAGPTFVLAPPPAPPRRPARSSRLEGPKGPITAPGGSSATGRPTKRSPSSAPLPRRASSPQRARSPTPSSTAGTPPTRWARPYAR